MCLDIHAKFRGDRPPRSEGGVKLTPPPPPSKNLLSKSPVKIGLTWWTFFYKGTFCHCQNLEATYCCSNAIADVLWKASMALLSYMISKLLNWHGGHSSTKAHVVITKIGRLGIVVCMQLLMFYERLPWHYSHTWCLNCSTNLEDTLLQRHMSLPKLGGYMLFDCSCWCSIRGAHFSMPKTSLVVSVVIVFKNIYEWGNWEYACFRGVWDALVKYFILC